jgi:shikimate dehydrogenase
MKTPAQPRASRYDKRKRKIVYLLGSGITKSLSPEIHNKAYRQLGLDIEYELCDIPENDFEPTLVRLLKDDRVLGFNVTIPFKELIIPHLTKLDPTAESARAVNLVSVSQDRRTTIGYNTDVDGIIASLSKLGFLAHSGLSAVVLGAGGAARGCLYAMLNDGFESVKILNRSEKRAKDVAGDFSRIFKRKEILWGSLNSGNFLSASSEIDLLVNTIPLNAELPFDIDFAKIPNRMKVLDLNYRKNPPILKAATKAGLVGIDGSLMLVEQAAKSFEILTGISPPRKTMMLAAQKQAALQDV